jgi:hypothetical protein
VAKFNNTDLQALPAGDAVSVSLTGDMERDGLVTPFTTMTTIRVIK